EADVKAITVEEKLGGIVVLVPAQAQPTEAVELIGNDSILRGGASEIEAGVSDAVYGRPGRNHIAGCQRAVIFDRRRSATQRRFEGGRTCVSDNTRQRRCAGKKRGRKKKLRSSHR